MVEIDGVSKNYDTIEAVRQLTLTVGAGQTFGLIGPNGSGKTTLLRMISTLAKPDVGKVSIDGIDAVACPRRVRRRLAFMPAEFGFPMHMSILEYMQYFAALYGVAREYRQSTVDQVLELTDLKGREDLNVRGLSTGNKQRVLLAKTLLMDPKLLLLDEPASGLDPRARSEVRAILKELALMGKTIIISSHILADIQDICSHVCILEAGEKVLDGEIHDLRRRIRTADRMVRLDLPEAQLEAGCQLVGALDDVLSCKIVEQHLEIASNQANCNFILQALLEADIEILGMHEDELDLEDVFIQSTRGIVT